MAVWVTSSLVTCVVLMTSWMTRLFVVTAATTTTTMAPTGSGSSEVYDDFNDQGVCLTRYMSSANASEGAGLDVVGVAAVIELRRPQGEGCGSVSGMGLQTVAALLWAVRRLNGQGLNPPLSPYIPGVRLLRVYDDCSHVVLAARHVGQLLAIHPDFNCTPSTPPLAGILGTTTSHTTTFVASLLANTHIPHFGISATVSVLSNHTAYPTFFRTVPSDLTQSKVLLDLVLHLQWTYVVGIYTKDNYGTVGFQEFKRLATKAGVCVFKEKAFWHSDHGVQDSMERFVRELLIELDTTRYQALGVIYFGHDTEATILFQMIQDRRSRWHDQDKVNQLHWVLSDGAGTSPSFASLAAHYSNLIAISPATSILDDINDYFFHVLDNPGELGSYWQSLVNEYLLKVEGCTAHSSRVSSCQLRDKIHPYDYLPAALDSFYSLAALLEQAHKEACGGAGIPGVCHNLSNALKNGLLSHVQPEAMNYSLHFLEERLPEQFRHDRMLVPDRFGDFMPANSPLYFLNSASSGQWTKIGEYCNGSLTFLPNRDSSSRSECGTDCKQCRKSDVIRFVYHPGDILLLGLYSISSPVATASFSCGDYRKQSSSVAALMAFLRAVETVAPQAGSGNNVTFGALVLDDCYNKLTASALLTDLFSGRITLHDHNTGQPIPMEQVKAVIGSQSSSVTLSALSLLTPLQIPTISYSATSPDLDDRISYPYFLRPVPSDSLQARALVDVVLLLNVTYVGAFHQDNNYGRRGMQEFVRMAEAEGICVETPIAVQDLGNVVDFRKAVRDIRNKDAMVVVVFLVEPSVLKLLDAIEGMNLDLIFLASEAWSLSTDTLQAQRGVTARGSLVLTVDSSREAGNVRMADYFKKLTIPVLTGHEYELPWVRDFWENEKQCNLAGGFTNSYNTMCSSNFTLSDEVVRELSEDQKVVQTINAVASVITAFEQHCGSHSDPAACMKGLSADTATRLIRSVHLRDQTGQSFLPYLNDSNGNVGFTLHNVQKVEGGTYRYVQVGQYNPAHGLQITGDIKFYDPVGQPINSGIVSTCLYKLQCRNVCGKGKTPTTPYPPVTPTSPHQQGDGKENGGLVAAVVVLALLCVALATVLMVAVCCAKRRGRIPGLGVVKKNASGPTSRASAFGEINMGFSPTSPRVSLPLPAIPQASNMDAVHQYNTPSDIDGQVSISRSSGTSSSLHGGPSSSRYDEVSHYDYSEGEGRGRRSRRHQFHPSSQHRDLQLQQQHAALSTASLPSAASGKDRRRARSVPRADRPDFLPVQGAHLNTLQSGVRVGAQENRNTPGRPRSYSHDAAFRERLGALSDDDQQILLKYMTTARQHSKSPRASQVPSMSPVTMSPVIGNREGGERPKFSLPPVQSQLSEVEGRGVASPNIVFENPPSFCSSKTSLRARPEDDPSLLYLHAIPAEKDLYLEVIADPSDLPPSSTSPHSSSSVSARSPPSSSPHPPSSLSPDSHPDTSPCSPPPASSTSPVSLSPLLPTSVPSHSHPSVTWPLLAVTSSPQSPPCYLAGGIPAGLVPKTSPSPSGSSVTSVTSPMSPPTALPLSPLISVCGSTASESSGAVFVSPDSECPPHRLSGPTDSLSPPVFRSPSQVNISPLSSLPQQSPSVQQAQTRTTPVMQGINMSPTNHTALSPEQLLQLINRHSKSQPPTAARHSTPQSSPQNAFPGMVVTDHTGALFWVPNIVVPLSQHSVPVSPSSSISVSPTAAEGSHSPHQSNFSASHSPTETLHSSNSFPHSSSHVTQPLPSPPPQQQSGMTQALHSPTNGLSKDRRPHSTVNSPPNLQAKSRKPKMGVDALSAQRRLTDVGDTNLSMPSIPVALGGSSESLNCARSTAKTSTSDVLTDHPGSPQATQAGPLTATGPPLSALGLSALQPSTPELAAPGPQTPSSSVILHGDGDSAVYVHSYQLMPTPSPCKPLSVPEVSGAGSSNHTSGDSGNGEDLSTDTDGNVNTTFEVCV